MCAVVALGVALLGQARADITTQEAAELDTAAKATLTRFQAETKGAEAVIANAKGVLVCPKITKAGFIVGVEGGSCVLYAGASTPLYYSTNSVKAGFLAGVQSYSMILVMNTDAALAKFTGGTREWEVGADVSVAIAKVGAGGSLDTTNLKRDVVAFIFGEKGLMADVSLEGSRFKKQDVEAVAPGPRATQQVDANLVGTWETQDGPCAPCTLTIAPNGTVSFTQAGSAVQVVFAQFTTEPGIDLAFPAGGKAELTLSKSNMLIGFYTKASRSERFTPVAFRRQ
jgi:lipid-binding SYLF domain-containing protein